MGERIEQATQADSEAISRRLLEIIVYEKACWIGCTLTLDNLAETEIGDWTMPNFRAACAYAASQGWLIVEMGCRPIVIRAVGLHECCYASTRRTAADRN